MDPTGIGQAASSRLPGALAATWRRCGGMAPLLRGLAGLRRHGGRFCGATGHDRVTYARQATKTQCMERSGEPRGRAAEKQRSRDADLAAIARGEKSAAQLNRENALGARVAGYFQPTFKFGVPSKRRAR